MPRARLIALTAIGALSVAAMAIGLLGQSRAGAGSPPQPVVQASQRGAEFEGAIMPDGVRAPDFELRDEEGRPVSTRALRGKVAIVTFLTADCDETCPPQAQQIRIALDRLGGEVPVEALAISADPRTGTPRQARHFLREQKLRGSIRWALGSRAELEPVWKGFAVQPQLRDAEHQARIVLIDPEGFQRVGFPMSETTPERLAHDVRVLAGSGRPNS